MSVITTTRSFQRGDNFGFTVAAKNGYGISIQSIPSMQDYLVAEDITNVGSEYPGIYNKELYPGVSITGTLADTSVNYNFTVNNNDGIVRQLKYRVGFSSNPSPISGDPIVLVDTGIDPYAWSATPLVLQTPQISQPAQEASQLYFTVWRCNQTGVEYNAGESVFINEDLDFVANWAIIPVSVSVENDTDNSDVPEFDENE